MSDLARLLVGFGIALVLLGALVGLVGKVPGVGRLPGDIVIERENFRLYLPLGTCLLVSVILSLLLWCFRR